MHLILGITIKYTSQPQLTRNRRRLWDTEALPPTDQHMAEYAIGVLSRRRINIHRVGIIGMAH